ncbi:hypothetical protein ACG04R_02900 [Roseateles sp. BYS78W]|uniref:Immunity protein 50 n=1 Tax=Pelomonas candidula TaxID=3299025 RepID=A0ABW7H7V8_9BURK
MRLHKRRWLFPENTLGEMRFLTPFQPPDELEMFDHGFGLAAEHDPEEAVLSFCRSYEDFRLLTVTFKMGYSSSVHVLITEKEGTTSNLSVEEVATWGFQSWEGESILRFSFSNTFEHFDLRLHYEPAPRVYFCALPQSA